MRSQTHNYLRQFNFEDQNIAFLSYCLNKNGALGIRQNQTADKVAGLSGI